MCGKGSHRRFGRDVWQRYPCCAAARDYRGAGRRESGGTGKRAHESVAEGESCMEKSIGFGIVGAGLVAPFHLHAIRDSRGGSAIGIFDISRERAGQVAEKFGIRVYSSLREMLLDGSVDVVCVATPNHLHRDTVLQAAAAGKHVLTEKPPAMSLRETDEMIDAC